MKTLREALDEAEHRYLLDVMKESRGVVSKAAEMAGVNRTDFYRRLHKHGIETPREFGNSLWQALGR